MKVLVIGGAGFIGRSVVAALVARHVEVVIGTRRPLRRGLAESSYRVERIELHRLTRSADWQARIQPFDVVVNCAGILRERWGETYAVVYEQAPTALHEACQSQGKRFIHVTALGLDPDASSGFITTKRASEKHIERIGGDVCIVRPSLLDGADGFGSRWLRRVAQWPLHLVPADAVGRLAPLHVDDLGEAISALCVCALSTLPKSVELGGETHYSLGEYLRALRRNPRRAITLRVPAWLVRLSAHLLDVVHLTPLSWGHVELMRRDNVPCTADTLALRRGIARAPRAVGSWPQAARSPTLQSSESARLSTP